MKLSVFFSYQKTPKERVFLRKFTIKSGFYKKKTVLFFLNRFFSNPGAILLPFDSDQSFFILYLTETGMMELEAVDDIPQEYNQCCSTCLNRRGGGVAIHVRKSICC